jgi:uncharacterized protein (DUF433 family)
LGQLQPRLAPLICGAVSRTKSAQLVLAAISQGASSQETIKTFTNLSERSIRYALEYLKQSGLIIEITDLLDARKKNYKEVKNGK